MSRSPDVLRLLAQVLVALADEQEKADASPAHVPPIGWLPIKRCGLPLQTAQLAVRSREIAASKVGRDIYVKRCDVEAYVERRRIGDREAAAASTVDGTEVDRAIAAKRLRLLRGGGRQ